MRDNPRPLPGTVLFKTKEQREVVTKITETPDVLTVHTRTDYLTKHPVYGNGYGEKPTGNEIPKPRFGAMKKQKYLCVGGPLHGEKHIAEEAPDYEQYNCATRYGRTKRTKQTDPPKVVLVWLQ